MPKLDELFEDMDRRQRLRIKFYSFKYGIQVKLVFFLMDLAQKFCNHMFCSIHQADDGTYFEVCTICGKELEADD